MFKLQHSFEQRKNESTKIREKYPDRYPIIVEKIKDSQIKDIDKHKFLVSSDHTVAQFTYVIRKRLKLKPEEAIYLFVNNTLPMASMLVSDLYRSHKDEDGFLYLFFSGEQTFGN